MRVKKVYETGFILQSVITSLYKGEVLDINYLCHKFDYSKCAMYRLISKINYNMALIDSENEVVRISKGKYKLNNIDYL